MADNEIQSLDDVLKEPEKNQNPSETSQPLLPVDEDGQANGHEKKNDVLHSEKKTDTKVQASSPGTGDENGKKRKTWLLSDSEVIIIIRPCVIWLAKD